MAYPNHTDPYAHRGDAGQTGLPDCTTVWKDDPRLEVCGSLDELNSILGLARAEALPPEIDLLLARIQHALLAAGVEVAAAGQVAPGVTTIGPQHVAALEQAKDSLRAGLEPLRGFILPGGGRAAALADLARAVCRRAERRLVTLVQSGQPAGSPHLLAYLNRLSNLLFVVARALNAHDRRPETPWDKAGLGQGAPE